MNEKMGENQFTPEMVADAVRSLLHKMGFTSFPMISNCRTTVNGENTSTHMCIDLSLSHGEMKMLRRMASGV